MTDDSDDKNNVVKFPTFVRVARDLSFRRGMYVLINKEPVPITDTMKWAVSFEQRHEIMQATGVDPWRVALTDVGDCYVSTVFLGLDHNYFGGGRPVLFETMIFHRKSVGEELMSWQDRCSTWDEAEAMHERGVAALRAGLVKRVGEE